MNTSPSELGQKLLRYGILLFLLGLLTGFVIPVLGNPRMGLSSHLEGVQNGMLLMLFGLIWPRLQLSPKLFVWGYFLSLYGTFTNWFTTLLAAIWGAGAKMMPIAGGDNNGTLLQEGLIKFGLISLSLSMIIVSVILIGGLKGRPAES